MSDDLNSIRNVLRLLDYSLCPYITRYIITFELADSHTADACVNKGEVAGLGIYAPYDSYVTYVSPTATRGEENQVSFAKVFACNRFALSVLNS